MHVLPGSLSLRAGRYDAGAGGVPGRHSPYFSTGAQSENMTSGSCTAKTDGARNADARRPGVLSVSGDGTAGGVENRFRERKLQHDLAVVVGDLDGRAEKRAVGAIGLEQLPDHGTRHFPGAVGIPEHFAVGVGNQLIADTGVEIISRHRRKLHSRWGPEIGGPHFPHGFLYGTPAAPRNPTIVIRNSPNNPETLDPTLF